jgi:hypothetical protein
MQHCTGVINAQVGAATSSEKRRLTQDAEEHCNLIADQSFWGSARIESFWLMFVL